MLGISTAEKVPVRARRPLGGDRTPTEHAAPAPAGQLAVLPPPDGSRSQDQRRAIGTLWLVASIVVDAAIIWGVLYTQFELVQRSAKLFGIVYLLASTGLLARTHRHGRFVRRPAESLVEVASRLALTPLITAALTLTADRPLLAEFNTRAYVVLWLITTALVMAGRLVMFKIIQRARRQGFDLEDTLIVGAGPVGVEVAHALEQNPEFGLLPVGFVDRFEERLPLPTVGRPERLYEVLEQTQVRNVVLAFGAASEAELVAAVRKASVLPVQFYTVPRFFELGVSAANVGHEVDGFALVPMRRPGHGHSMWPMKRAFDLVVASLLLVLASPVLAACAVLVKLSSAGPILFKQVRVGVSGRPFEIYKFRSMRVNDDHHTTWSVDDDQRVTKVGRILRQTHLDELPQLFNVLRGDMSIVGPRPERPYFVEQFSSEIDGYGDRHRVPVGITGWAQVNGYWGDTSIEARVRLDNRYIENWSPWRDLVIALRTIPTLLGRRR
jgi:exopolysaccharide biosynthesis polyprenyl glycosylphosphotransferase